MHYKGTFWFILRRLNDKDISWFFIILYKFYFLVMKIMDSFLWFLFRNEKIYLFLHFKLFFDVEIYLFWCSYMVVRKCGNVLWVTNVHWYAWQHPNHIVKSEMSQYLARNTKKNSFMVYPSISYYVNFILSNIWAIFNFSSFI